MKNSSYLLGLIWLIFASSCTTEKSDNLNTFEPPKAKKIDTTLTIHNIDRIDFIKADLKGTGFKNLREATDSLRSIYRLPFIQPQTVFSIIDWKYMEET